MSENIAEIIKACRFFRGLSAPSLNRLAELGHLKRFQPGEIIFRQGQACPGLFIVGAGSVRIYKLAPGGKEHVLHFAYEGMTFAEVAAIGQFECPAFAEAIEETVCVLLPQEPFLAALRSDHPMCLQLLASMSGWVRHLVGLLEDIVLRDATSRVANHLLQRDSGREGEEFALPMLKRDLASHLNLTSETLSRTLRRLSECNLIDMPDQQKIRLIDRDSLGQVAHGILPEEFA